MKLRLTNSQHSVYDNAKGQPAHTHTHTEIESADSLSPRHLDTLPGYSSVMHPSLDVLALALAPFNEVIFQLNDASFRLIPARRCAPYKPARARFRKRREATTRVPRRYIHYIIRYEKLRPLNFRVRLSRTN